MTPVNQPKKRDSESLILLTAIGLSLAVTLGVSFSATATGALQEAISAVTVFGTQQNTKLAADVEVHGGAITELNQALRAVKGQIAMISSDEGNELGAEAEHRLAKIDADVAALTAKIEALATEREVALMNSTLSGQVAGLETGLSVAGLEIGALRTSLEGRDEKRGKEIAALTTRLEKLESIVNSRDITSSIRKPVRKRTVRHASKPPQISAPEYLMVDGAVQR